MIHMSLRILLPFLIVPCAAFADPLPDAVKDAMERGYGSSEAKELSDAARVMEEHLQTAPGSAEVRQALGILYLDRMRDAAKALPHLETIAADLPEDPGWQQALARAQRGAGQSAEAAASFRKAAGLQPGDAWVRYELANTLSASGKYAAAVAAYSEALARDPKLTDAWLALAKTLRADGREVEARKSARMILAYDPKNAAAQTFLAVPMPTTPPQPTPASKWIASADAAVAVAWKSGRKQDFLRAAQLLDEALRREPQAIAQRKTLGFLYLDKLHSPAQAVPHLEAVCIASPRDTAWLQMLAKAQTASGDREAAVQTLRRVAKAMPRDVWSRFELGKLLSQLGRKEEAEAAFREALAIDPRNVHVRRELARAVQSAGRADEARSLADALVSDDPRDTEALTIRGDLRRAAHDFSAAQEDYRAALGVNPMHPGAHFGINEIRKAQRPQVKLAFYTFDDTDGLRQSGIFSYASLLVTGRLQASVYFNERFFKRFPGETIERFESGLGLDYRLSGMFQLGAGVSQFKTSNLRPETGANVALYFSPIRWMDCWLSYRHADPVNDSYITARDSFTQNTVAGGMNVRFNATLSASVTAGVSDYSDGNMRRSVLASLAWKPVVRTSPVVKLEYEWLDFDDKKPAYSSPQNYGRIRPVLEFSPKITDWLKLELHGELDYVTDTRQWGTGLTAGPRITIGDRFEIGLSYMNYKIPGGQTTWSGEGFKVEAAGRF